MGCFDDSPSDSADAGSPSDAGVPLPAGVPDPTTDPTNPVTVCANSCASTLRIDGCRVVAVNGRTELLALIDCGAGGFHWSTSSTKVTLTGVDNSSVQVRAGAQPSGGRDQEIITVQWTYGGCSPLSASFNITVVNVVFSESAAQSYGYDDMDTPANQLDDHVSVKQLGSTLVHVVVQGGLNGNELRFDTLDDSKARVGALPAQAAFDLTINGRDQTKAETNLVAYPDCGGASEITRIFINVYKEKVVRATVAKVYDSRHAGTTLNYANLSIPSTQSFINPKAKAAVVRYEMSDQSATGGAIDIPFDNDGNGKLTWDITAHGGTEFIAIRDGFSASDTRIAIVRDMISFYYLSAATAIGDTTITLRGISNNNFLLAGSSYSLGTGTSQEPVTVQTVSLGAATVTLSSGLTKIHAVGASLEYNAAGWSSNPIIVTEGTASEEVIKKSLFHETGHRALGFDDLEALTNVMHFNRDRTTCRIRYKPENKKRSAGTENQWQLISR